MNSVLQQTAETTNYMIAGYVVIFGTMLIYLVSLILRRRSLEKDAQVLAELEAQETSA